MDAKEMIAKLEAFCKAGELDTYVPESPEQMEMPVLMVFLGNDAQAHERILQITVARQEMGEELGGGPKEGRSFFSLNFRVLLPYEIHDDVHSDLCSTLCFINPQLLLPGFEYLETEDHLIYRYVLVGREDTISETQIQAILGLIIYNLDMYGELIREVAIGKTSFEGLVEQVMAYTQKITMGDFSLIEDEKQ